MADDKSWYVGRSVKGVGQYVNLAMNRKKNLLRLNRITYLRSGVKFVKC